MSRRVKRPSRCSHNGRRPRVSGWPRPPKSDVLVAAARSEPPKRRDSRAPAPRDQGGAGLPDDVVRVVLLDDVQDVPAQPRERPARPHVLCILDTAGEVLGTVVLGTDLEL